MCVASLMASSLFSFSLGVVEGGVFQSKDVFAGYPLRILNRDNLIEEWGTVS